MLCHSLEIMDNDKFDALEKIVTSNPTCKIFYCGKKLCRNGDLKTYTTYIAWN